MPRLRHELIACVLPPVRRTRDLDTPDNERARLLRRNDALEPALPTGLVPRFHRWFTVDEETSSGPTGDVPSYVITPRCADGELTIFYVHGGGYVAPLDPF